MYKKGFFLLILLIETLVYGFDLVPASQASENFTTSINVNYIAAETGLTRVVNDISLTNLTSELYATSYSLILSNIEISEAQARYNGSNLIVKLNNKNDKKVLEVEFPDALVGKAKKRDFQISYTQAGLAKKTGEVWEISIPRLADTDSFDNYSVNLTIPTNFGFEAYVSPQTRTFTQDSKYYYYSFDKADIAKIGVVAGFGSFQVFSFDLKYHLENPLSQKSSVEIAIPPDTNTQKLYYQSIAPKPENVRVDEDGNWLATFNLASRQRLDVSVLGAVQIFAGARPFPVPSQETLTKNTLSSKYWQTTSPEISSLAKNLASPKAIYDYLVQSLTYNYDRVAPNVERYGALKALANPRDAICMEYSDLFVALARAANIPAREVQGFAYTENPTIQPLSLVADVLHSWPEYWDAGRSTWVQIDPTWGSTTGGTDYFNKLDLRHFIFVIHGADSEKPYPPGSYKLGPNPQKDVFVNFGQLPQNREPKITIQSKNLSNFPLKNSRIEFNITNSGASAVYDLTVSVKFDNSQVSKTDIGVLLPYANYTFIVEVPFSFLGAKTPSKVVVDAAEASLEVPTAKNQVIIYNLFILSTILVILIGLLVIKFKIKIPKMGLKHNVQN